MLNTAPGRICGGNNSGFQAINLAYHFGARRIILLGYDMQFTGGKTHWHGDHPKGLANPSEFSRFLQHFPALAAGCKQAGVEVINCTRQTALEAFPRADLHEALK